MEMLKDKIQQQQPQNGAKSNMKISFSSKVRRLNFQRSQVCLGAKKVENHCTRRSMLATFT